MKESSIKELVLITWTFVMIILDFASSDSDENNPWILMTAIIMAGVLYYICGSLILMIINSINAWISKKL
jgi:biotin transporter BioY